MKMIKESKMNTIIKLCYEIQGFNEICGGTVPSEDQWNKIVTKINETELCETNTDGKMKPEQFLVWVKGYIELTDGQYVTQNQWDIITDHLQLVFTKFTPDRKQSAVEVSVDDKTIQDVLDKLKPDKWESDPNKPPLTATLDNEKFCSSMETAC
jgi:hypothetical protein